MSAREGPLGAAFTCPSVGATTPVTLPEVDTANFNTGKPFRLDYAPLPLTFGSVSPAAGALCSVASTAPGALKVSVEFGPFSIRTSTSTADASVDFLLANDPATNVPTCDFSLVDAVGGPGAVPDPKIFPSANNCLLLASAHPAGGIIARWHTPGFSVTALGIPVHTTMPLTYYVDLSTIPGLNMSSSPSFATILQAVESYMHITLVTHLPMIDKMWLVQDPPAHLTVTDPLGRSIGFSRDSVGYSVTPGFPQAGYAEVGGRSMAWILDPVPGRYRVTARGPSHSLFNADVSVLELLGHGTAPLIQDTAWSGTLGWDGQESRTFTVSGASVEPVLAPAVLVGGERCDGGTTVKAGQPVSFTLGRSVIPMGLATVTWTFGDGGTAAGDPAGWAGHAYAVPGTYTPSLTVTDMLGDTAVISLPSVTVRAEKEGRDGTG